ncbi:RNA-binding protein, putative [Plasmodium gallinaceum]|uniref:RNA-binding protein, putative n=1 Tax=Plasmodium gallinaceum TaxID=5849 RepID=A0A1J1GXE6_PLAGA|nr:RNA-binding protein, putative [Plasmodium gallinaceum]CRG97233.1 RNA-binding protein, putative [Plasmodium gallinaceum]
MNTKHNNSLFEKFHSKNNIPSGTRNNFNIENGTLIKKIEDHNENIVKKKNFNKNLGDLIYNISKLILENTNKNSVCNEEYLLNENKNNNNKETETYVRNSMNNSENNNIYASDEKNEVEKILNNIDYNKKERKLKFISNNNKYNNDINSDLITLNNNIKNSSTKIERDKLNFFVDAKSYNQNTNKENDNIYSNTKDTLNIQNYDEEYTMREIKNVPNFCINDTKKDSKNNPIYKNVDYIERREENLEKNYKSYEENIPFHTKGYNLNNEKIKHNNISNQIIKEIKRNKDTYNLKNIVITNVFLGNIPPNITEERLKNVLEIFGFIIHVEYKWSVDKWSYAFVYFIDEKCAINAVNILNQKKFFDNSPNHKLICFIVSKQVHNQNTLQYNKANFSLLKDGPPGANLFLYGIPLKWTELNLIQLVNKYGHVVGLRIPYVNKENDKKQGNRGFGFVSYDNKKSAIEAFEELSKMYIHGKLLKVQLKNGEEHLLPAKLKNIYNVNKNKVKDNNNTKSAQSLVSTTDTLKTLNSINSTDIKKKFKNKCSSNNVKLNNFIKNKNKSSNSVSNNTNKNTQNISMSDTTCSKGLLENESKNNYPSNNSNNCDYPSIYSNAKIFTNISDSYDKCIIDNKNFNIYTQNFHYNTNAHVLSNEYDKGEKYIFDINEINYERNDLNSSKRLDTAKENENDNKSLNLNDEKNINKFLHNKDNITKKTNMNNKTSTCNNMNNKFNYFNVSDNNDSEKGKKISWKKKKNPQLLEQKAKHLNKSFNYTSKTDTKRHHININSNKFTCNNFFEIKNLDRNPTSKLNNLKNKTYNEKSNFSDDLNNLENSNSTSYSNTQNSNVNVSDNFYINNTKTLPTNEQNEIQNIQNYKNHEIFKKIRNKMHIYNENKNICSFLNNIWYNNDNNNNNYNDIKYGSKTKGDFIENNCHNEINKILYYNENINNFDKNEKDHIKSDNTYKNNNHINNNMEEENFHNTYNNDTYGKKNLSNYFKNMQFFLKILNSYSKENLLKIDDYFNDENKQLQDILNNKFNKELDKKDFEYLIKTILLKKKEKENEIYNNIPYLKEREDYLINSASGDLFNSNYFNLNFYGDNAFKNQPNNEKCVASNNKIDHYLKDIYINDYVNIHNYDKNVLNFEIKNDNKNINDNKIYDNNFISEYQSNINKYIYHDYNKNDNNSNSISYKKSITNNKNTKNKNKNMENSNNSIKNYNSENIDYTKKNMSNNNTDKDIYKIIK